MRAATRASSDGTASSVTVVDMIRSTSATVSEAVLQRLLDRPRPERDGNADELVVGLASRAAAAPRPRQGQVPVADPGVAVQALEEGAADALGSQDLGERLRDLRLGVAVSR